MAVRFSKLSDQLFEGPAIGGIRLEALDRLLLGNERQENFCCAMLALERVVDERLDDQFTLSERHLLPALGDPEGLAQFDVEELFEVLDLLRTALGVAGLTGFPLAVLWRFLEPDLVLGLISYESPPPMCSQ